MTIDIEKYSKFLEIVAEQIDIPPSKYQEAVDRYQAIGSWLEEGEYLESMGDPSIYPQGSFRLGTVVRPIRDGVEADYDIDLVCELQIPKSCTDARCVKMMVGDRLCEHEKYRKLLDKEGKRCWTLKYAEKDGIGFHLDVLPAVPDYDTSIAITNKSGETYDWSASDPKGYGVWFDSKNQTVFDLVLAEQKQSIQSRASTIYASVDEVPDQLVRTPLQRSIQIMKRHRDLKFNNEKNNDYAPISIIITTLAAELYHDEQDVFFALTEIISKLYAYAGLIGNGTADWPRAQFNLITRMEDGKWYIGNPVNPEENFADRWHENNHARAIAFFSWVEALKEDLVDIPTVGDLETVRRRLKTVLGASVVSGYLDLISATPITAFVPPKIPISTPAAPWGISGSPNVRRFE